MDTGKDFDTFTHEDVRDLTDEEVKYYLQQAEDFGDLSNQHTRTLKDWLLDEMDAREIN